MDRMNEAYSGLRRDARTRPDYGRYIRDLNQMREVLIAHNARENAHDEKLTLAIDAIATTICALGGTVSEVSGYDCA